MPSCNPLIVCLDFLFVLLFYLLHCCKSRSSECLNVSQHGGGEVMLVSGMRSESWGFKTEVRRLWEIGLFTSLLKAPKLHLMLTLQSAAATQLTQTAKMSLNIKQYSRLIRPRKWRVLCAVFVLCQSSSQSGHTRGFLLPQLLKDCRTACKRSHCDKTLANSRLSSFLQLNNSFFSNVVRMLHQYWRFFFFFFLCRIDSVLLK